jgi:hypothetical protein
MRSNRAIAVFFAVVAAAASGILSAMFLAACGPDVEQKTVSVTQTTDTINTVTRTTTAKTPPTPTKTVTEQVKPPAASKKKSHDLPPGTFQVNSKRFLVRIGYESNIPALCPPVHYSTYHESGNNHVDEVTTLGNTYWQVKCKGDLPSHYFKPRPQQGWLPSPYVRTRGDQHTTTKKETARR